MQQLSTRYYRAAGGEWRGGPLARVGIGDTATLDNIRVSVVLTCTTGIHACPVCSLRHGLCVRATAGGHGCGDQAMQARHGSAGASTHGG